MEATFPIGGEIPYVEGGTKYVGGELVPPAASAVAAASTENLQTVARSNKACVCAIGREGNPAITATQYREDFKNLILHPYSIGLIVHEF